jgi:thioesterase domain-containing protein
VKAIVRRVAPASLPTRQAASDAVDEAERVNRRVIDFGMRMATEHRYDPYRGRIHLFYGRHWPEDYLDRWSAVAADGAKGFLLPGGHLEMMEEPHVRSVATNARDSLQSLNVFSI